MSNIYLTLFSAICIIDVGDNMKNYIVILLVCIFSLGLYLISGYTSKHDTAFHYVNSLELKEQILDNGIFGNYIVDDIGSSFGYGTRLFYPPLAHYFIAFTDILVNDIVISVKIFNFIAMFSAGIFMYLFAKYFYDDDKLGLVSSVIYMTGAYHLSDIYIRDSLAETLVFSFIPLIMLGVYKIINEGKGYSLFIIGYFFGILSHATMMMYFTVIVGIYLLLNKKIVFTKEVFMRFLASSILVLCMTSFFWYPMLEVKMLGNYMVFKEGVMVQGTWGNALNPLIYIYPFVNKMSDVMYHFDFVSIVIFGFTLYNYKKIDTKFKQMLLLLFLCIIWSSILFPWDLLPLSLRLIQFPWRIVTFSSLFFSLLVPFCLKDKNIKVILVVLCFSSVVPFVSNLWTNGRYLFNNNTDSYLNYEAAMGWQKEYLPVNTYDNMIYYLNRSDEIEGGKVIVNDVPYLEFTVFEDGIYELPRLFYPGYVLKSLDDEFELYENDNGFVSANLVSGNYILSYEGTDLHNLFNYISLVSIGLFFTYYLASIYKRRSYE